MPELVVIESLKEKVARLIADNKSQRQQVAAAQKTTEKLRKENKQLGEKITELQRRITALELGEALKGPGGNKQARARVNLLMREIDRCIALLNAE